MLDNPLFSTLYLNFQVTIMDGLISLTSILECRATMLWPNPTCAVSIESQFFHISWLDTFNHQLTDCKRSPLTGLYVPSPVLGAVPELCLCQDLELDCDGGQLPDVPVVAVNVTMMWVRNQIFLNFFFYVLKLKQLWVSHVPQHLTRVKAHLNVSTRFVKDS